METIAIEALMRTLSERLTKSECALVEMKLVGPSGLLIRVEGEHCLSAINIWPNGCCDIEYLYVASEKGKFEHFEFGSQNEAIEPVLQEVRSAIKRA
jgi:hypothetical protein